VPLGSRLLVRLNVYNITDRTYIRSINNNAGRYNPGTPRSFLLSTSVNF
jgi:catecholate siderophore receptor